ncbi:uncharacterized protein TNCV_1742291 [Trichonephila clavipes]|nr:uncharacterized protein TNCV_1742291 [Trichonephila clavipes]
MKLSYVSDIVLSPPNSDKYHTLSQRLITQFSDSETQKIKKLLTDLQLNEKPSHLLRKMKELSNGQLQDDFLQSLWLQRMSPHIQTVLSASSESLDKLAIIADKGCWCVLDYLCGQKCSSTIPVIFMQCSANHGLSRQADPRAVSTRVSIEEVASATIITVIKSRPESVFHLVHLCKTSTLCHSWNGRALETYQPVILLDRKSGQKFLIDSGSEICVIPPSPTMNKSPQSNFSLFAANNTKIPAYDLSNPSLISKSASHGTVHHIITGPPVTARPRRLHPKLYDAVKVEFEFLLAQGIRPSKSVPGVLLFMLCPNLTLQLDLLGITGS